MKSLSILFYALLFFQQAWSQELPGFTAETVESKVVNLPEAIKGKYSLICFASSLKAQDDLESWLDPIYQKFIAKTGLMDDMYDVNVYFIPVLTGTNISYAASIKKKFKANTQADLLNHVLFCKEEGKSLLAALNVKDNDKPYFLLLDKTANIIYRTSGRFTEEKFDSIDDLIE